MNTIVAIAIKDGKVIRSVNNTPGDIVIEIYNVDTKEWTKIISGFFIADVKSEQQWLDLFADFSSR